MREKQPWITSDLYVLWFCLRIGNTDIICRDIDLIEKGKLGALNKNIAEIEKMLKALISSLENKPLNP